MISSPFLTIALISEEKLLSLIPWKKIKIRKKPLHNNFAHNCDIPLAWPQTREVAKKVVQFDTQLDTESKGEPLLVGKTFCHFEVKVESFPTGS